MRKAGSLSYMVDTDDRKLGTIFRIGCGNKINPKSAGRINKSLGKISEKYSYRRFYFAISHREAKNIFSFLINKS